VETSRFGVFAFFKLYFLFSQHFFYKFKLSLLPLWYLTLTPASADLKGKKEVLGK